MRAWASSLFLLTLMGGCSLDRTPILPDVGLDAGDAGMDAGRDAPPPDGGPEDTGVDTPGDGGMDADLDAPIDDTGIDAPDDTGVDAPIDTGVDAPVDTGVDAPCITRCSDPMTLSTCVGAVETVETCPIGCYDAPSPHCAEMVPANVGNTWETATSAGAVSVNTLERINTTTCVWDRAADLTGSIRSADTGGNVCLFVVDSLDVQVAGAVHASGNLALIIVSRGDITIAGAIGVDSARSSTLFGAVSGAGPRGPAAGNGGSSGFDDGGGGGGGFGGAGGAGGTGGSAGAAGAVRVSSLLPLTGGSAGGLGAGPSTAAGGSGGGVMQLTALGRFTVRGYVGASGAGGESGRLEGLEAGAGGGGGSGGGILLEAITFSLEAGTINIAGGGGGGGACSTTNASAGADGIDVATARASGGGRACGGSGGNGGDGSGGTFQTGAPGGNSNNGGGGGGGAGQVVFRTPGSTLDLSAAGSTLNPTFASSAARYVVSDIGRR